MIFHFGKRAPAPLWMNVLRDLGSIVDGITGLMALPFGRFGTGFSGDMCEKILRWQVNKRRAERRTE